MVFTVSLRNNYEFRRLYARGKSAVTPLIAIYYRTGRPGGNKLGITVGGKIGKAVTRNLIRRRLKEIYRQNEYRIRPGYDIVIVARMKSRYESYTALEADFLKLMKKLGLLL